MQLLKQPEDGVLPILRAIWKARRTIDIHIFRLDYKEIEKASRPPWPAAWWCAR
jgi:hypothetical protein